MGWSLSKREWRCSAVPSPQLGYAVAAFGTEPVRHPIGLQLSTIFAAGSIVAVLLAFHCLVGHLTAARGPQHPSVKKT